MTTSGPLGVDIEVGRIEVPDVAEPIRAYRGWSLTHLGLQGFESVLWPVGKPLRAECRTRQDSYLLYGSGSGAFGTRMQPHKCPSPPGFPNHAGHGCGVYAYRTLDDCLEASWVVGGSKQVFGEVLLWGEVYDHDKGYRAEWAQPDVIYDLPLKAGGMLNPAGVAEFYGLSFVKPDIDVARWDLRAEQRELERLQQSQSPATLTGLSGYVTTSQWQSSSGFTVSLEDTEPDGLKARSRRTSWLVRSWWAAMAGANVGVGAIDVATGHYIAGGTQLAIGVGICAMSAVSNRG